MNRLLARRIPARVASTVVPVPPHAALAVVGPNGRRTALIVADLHLGLAAGPAAPAGPPEGSARELARTTVALARSQRVRRVVVAGDVKHPIVGVPAWLRPVVFDYFATLLDAGVVPEVVLGNHDGGLVRHLPREVVVHPAGGAVIDGVGVFHGHCWPSAAVLARPNVVAGHLHPGFRFAPTASAPDGKRRVWVRVRYGGARRVVRPDRRPTPIRQLVVLPAFHPLAGTEALNRERPRRGRSFLFGRFLRRGEARAYLLDGTDLGPIATPPPSDPDGRGRPGRRAR